MKKIAERILTRIAKDIPVLDDIRGVLDPSMHQRTHPVSDPSELIMQKGKVQESLKRTNDELDDLHEQFHEHEAYPELKYLVRYLIETGDEGGRTESKKVKKDNV